MYVLPTFTGVGTNEKSNYPFNKKINLGLDLQGGLYLVMGIDFNKVFKEITDRQLASVTERLKEKNISISDAKVRTDGVSLSFLRLKSKT
jgi:preprotein translocase subunit SecD